MRWTFTLGVMLAGCGGAGTTATAPGGPPASASAPAADGMLETMDATLVAAELRRLARAGERERLDALVDWEYVRRLARVSGAFEASVEALQSTLAAMPACEVTWATDEGGHRLDFAPALVDDTEEAADAKDAVKAELYQGEDAIASCNGEEAFLVQLVRSPDRGWRVRGWGSLVYLSPGIPD